jgi:hypothetical protein
MQKSARTTIVIAVLVAVVAGGLALASPSTHLAGPRTITFRAITDQSKFLNLDGNQFSQGDEFVFHDVLRQGDRRIGHDGGVCTVTDAARGEFQCVVTFVLGGGQVTSQGLLVIPQTGVFQADFAVTGGTGSFRNVGGDGEVDQMTETAARITLNLIVP